MKTTKKEGIGLSFFNISPTVFASSRFSLLFSHLFPIFIDIIFFKKKQKKNLRYES